MNTKKNNKSRNPLWGFLFLGLLGVYGLITLPVEAAPFAYVTHNNDNGSVTVIDTATNTVVSTIGVGSYPGGVAVTPNGDVSTWQTHSAVPFR